MKEEKDRLISKAMTDLDGIEARLNEIWPKDKPAPDLRCDLEMLLDC